MPKLAHIVAGEMESLASRLLEGDANSGQNELCEGSGHLGSEEIVRSEEMHDEYGFGVICVTRHVLKSTVHRLHQKDPDPKQSLVNC